MLAEERRQKIIEEVNTKGSVHVVQLSEFFDVTEETIRRDLEKLEQQELLKRTYGGAISVNNDNELSFNIRQTRNKDEKQEIARRAKELISSSDTLFLDASTTALFLARELMDFDDITVITNSVRISEELARNRNITLICTGGILRHNSLSFVGPLAKQTIQKYYAQKMFVSCKGISSKYGVTESNELEIEIKQKMLSNAKEVILLADHTKFDHIGLSRFAELKDLDMIITDSGINDIYIESLEHLVEVTVV